jgi:hypothetical protein
VRTWRQSQIEDMLDCPEKFRRSYMTEQEGGTSASAMQGTAVHVAMASAQILLRDAGEILTPEEVAKHARTIFDIGLELDTQGEDPIEWRDGSAEERRYEVGVMAAHLWEKAPSVFESYGGPLIIEHTFSEAPVLFDLGLSGTWDVLTDRHYLIDWKTSRSGWKPGKQHDKMQPLVYAKGVEHVTGHWPVGFVFVVASRPNSKSPKGRIQVFDDVDVSPERVAYLEELLPPLQRMVDGGIFPMNPGSNLCNELYCPWFLRGCPAGPMKMRRGGPAA